MDAKRIYGIVNLMLSKVREIESSGKKTSDKDRKDLLKLQTMLSRELR